MKILLLDVNCKYSSTGKIVYELYSNLQAQGHQAVVCYGRGKKIDEPNVYKFGWDWETNLHAVLARITGFNGCFSFFSTRRLIKYIEKFQPDVIHIHELHAYFVNIKPLLDYIKKKKIRTVWTFHCEYMYTGKCGHAYECEKWKTECGECPAVREYPKSLWLDRTKEMFRMKRELLRDLSMTVVTPSKWLADRVRQSFLKEKDVRIIYNGADAQIFHPVDVENLKKELKIPSEYKIVLAVAPNLMSEAKGGEWILKLAERMREEKIIFVLVGTTWTGRVRDNVICIKKITEQKELAKFYSLADVFVICSKKETFSLSCAESLLCGKMVVGFQSGAPETVFEEPFATFVPYGELELLQEAILDTLKKELTVDEVVDYSQRYSKEVMVQQYMELYEDCLKQK